MSSACAFGPLAGAGNKFSNHSVRTMVEKVNDAEQKIWKSKNNKAIFEWDEWSENFLYEEVDSIDYKGGTIYWNDLEDYELEEAEQVANSIILKYK